MPRPKNTTERRHQIVEALIKVMAKRGYERASVTTVARTADLTPGLVHYHFKNKQEILLALMGELATRLEQRIQRRDETARTPRDHLDAYIDGHVALGEDADPDAVSCWVAVSAESLRQPEVQTLYNEIVKKDLDELKRLVYDVLEEEGRDPDLAEGIAAGLYSAIEGSYHLAIAARVAPPGFAAPALRQMAAGLLDQARTTSKNQD